VEEKTGDFGGLVGDGRIKGMWMGERLDGDVVEMIRLFRKGWKDGRRRGRSDF
jgi:hypothetical protein